MWDAEVPKHLVYLLYVSLLGDSPDIELFLV